MSFIRQLFRLLLAKEEDPAMVSKKKRRRQRDRAEAKRKMSNNVNSQELKLYKEYRVATQLRVDAAVTVTTIKEYDEDELIKFVCRMAGVKDKSEFTFLEIHHTTADGKVQLIVDGGNWPYGVATIHNQGFVVRGKERPLVVRNTKSSKVVTPMKADSAAKTGVFKETFIPKLKFKLKYYSPQEAVGMYG